MVNCVPPEVDVYQPLNVYPFLLANGKVLIVPPADTVKLVVVLPSPTPEVILNWKLSLYELAEPSFLYLT